LIHPEDVEAFDRAGGEARRSLSAFDHEYRIRHDDGVYRWVRALARPFRSDESGVLWHGAILDVSAQKAAESRLRTTVEQIPGVVFSFSQRPDGNGSMHVLSAGGAILSQPGSDATPASEYERFWSAVHPEDRESLRTGADEASKSGEPLIARCRLLQRDHDARMVQMVARVSAHEQGRREWVGVLLDVSDRAESDDRFRTLVENLPGAAHSYTIGPDRAPDVIHLGASIDEIVGPKNGATRLRQPEHLRHLVHEEDLHRFDRAWSGSIRRQPPLDFEFRIHTDLGDYRSVRWVSHPTLGAKRVVWHGILFDVTGRREAEDRFRALADAIPGAVHSYVVRCDGTHEFLYKSPGFRTLLGPETFERFRSLEDYMNEVVHPEDRGRVQARSRSASRELEPFDHEYRIVVDGERTKWVRSVVRPMPTAGGSVIWHAVSLDVTDRREAEMRSRIHAEHLIEANQMLHLETIVSEESRLSKERTLALVHAKMREAAEALRVHASMLERTDLTPKERLAVSREMRRHAHELLRSLDGPARERLVAHYAFPGE
jgi:PAS domain S-box-containing protein